MSTLEQPWIAGARDVVEVSGADAASFLQSQVSQDLRPMADGDMSWTLVLQPTGKVEVLARLRRVTEQHWLLDVDAGFGERLVDRLARFKIRVDVTLTLTPVGEDGSPAEDLELARIRAGWPRLGAEIIPGETIPAETGVVDVAVSFTKGCYPGQELVERIDSRGAAAPRQVRHVTVPSGTRPGDDYIIDGEVAGTVTSVVGSDALALVKRAFLVN